MEWLENLRSARQLGYRHCLLLAGSAQWCRQLAVDIVAADASTSISTSTSEPTTLSSISSSAIWLGDDSPQLDHLLLQPLSPRSSQSLLGRDSDCIVVDFYSSCNADVLGRATGALNGSGLLLLLAPPLADWGDYDDPDYLRYRAIRPESYRFRGFFLRRFRRLLQEELQRDTDACLSLIEQSVESISPSDFSPLNFPPPSPPSRLAGCFRPTLAQRQVVQAVLELMSSGRSALTLSADRGRGKSVALGLAVAELLKGGPFRVAVTSPLKSNVRNFFSALDPAQSKSVTYLPVDRLLLPPSDSPRVDLLIVDEAAAVPLPVLDRLSVRYQRLVFSSTVHGYEGSGRGFSLRFKGLLQQRFRHLSHCSLREPLRWCRGDPLERFFNKALLLDAGTTGELGEAVASPLDAAVASDAIRLRWVSAEELLSNESLLKKIFSLLAAAHYQTRPSDLRYLLDVPYVKLLIAESDALPDTVLAVLLVCEEGAFGEEQRELIAAIVRAERRPRGNLLAQLLANQSGDGSWCRALSWRVMRIAVDEGCRRRGLGSMLLAEMARQAKARGCSYWGTSFGFDRRVLDFWVSSGARPLSLGLHLDRASGARNTMLAAPLAPSMQQRIERLCERLRRDCSLWQARYWTEFDAEDIAALQRVLGSVSPAESNTPDTVQQAIDDQRQIERFLAAEIDYDRAYPALYRYVQRLPVDRAERLPLTRASLEQTASWRILADKFRLAGRRGVIEAIKTELIGATVD